MVFIETKFTGKADNYDRYRPYYPKESIDFLYEKKIIKKDDIIADVGCGTGILSNTLADRGNTVIGIDINLDMLRIAKQRLAEYKNCILIHALAENTSLGDNSVDCITAAQAFHWFNKKQFKTECQRILKPDGNVILLWNSTDNKIPINIQIANINKRLCEKFEDFSSRCEEKSDTYAMFFRDNKCNFRLFRNDLLLDKKNFVGRNLSRSYAPNENDSNYEEYVYELGKIFNKYESNEKVLVPNQTSCYFGKV